MTKRIQITFSLLLLLFSISVFSQLPENKIVLLSGDTVEIKPLRQSEITPQSEEVNKRVNEIERYLEITNELDKIDSVITVETTLFGKERDKVLQNVENYSQMEIEDLITEWGKHIEMLKSNQETASDITKKLENDFEYLDVTKKTWQFTYKSIKDNKGPAETLKWVNDVVQVLKVTEDKVKQVQNQNVKIQNNIVSLMSLSNDVIQSLSKEQLNWTSQYFVQNSPAIWNLSDTLKENRLDSENISANLKKNIQSVWDYFVANFGDVLLMIFIFIVLLLFYYLSYKKLMKSEIEDDEISSQKLIFSHYISSSFLLTILANVWISPERPLMVTQFLVILLLFPALILYSSSVSRRLRPYLLIVVLLFLIDETQLFFGISSFHSRIFYFIKSGIVLWLFLLIANPKGFIQKEQRRKWGNAAFILLYIFIILVIVSVFANIFGYLNLSVLLLRATVGSLLFAIILNIVNAILLGSFSYVYNTKAVLFVNLIKNHLQLIKKRTNQIITFYLSYLWVKTLFGYFGLWNTIIIWLGSALQSTWDIGPVSISFGAIITFFLMLIITFTLSKVITIILREEVFPRIVLPRGVPDAIIKVLSYIIIAYGLYISIEEAGVDFKQFGLIAGALGVGIGFGLQNIVANFISGLVLSFERPIQAGDTIEVGTLMGDVKNIGARASTVKTFDGAEIIVPNSNLISNDVINWTLSDRKRRRIVKVGTAYGSNPHQVLELLYDVASKHPSVLTNPKPWITFDGFGDSSLNFTVRFWATFDTGMTIQSEVAMNIYDALNDAGIQIPFPQQDLHIKSFDPTVQTTVYPWTKKNNDKKDLTSGSKKPVKRKKDIGEDDDSKEI